MPYFELPRLGPYWMHALSVMAFVAGTTERVRIDASVLVLPYHHPLELAKALSTIDVLSAGRLNVSVGVGHAEAEFASLGIPFAERAPGPATRSWPPCASCGRPRSPSSTAASTTSRAWPSSPSRSRSRGRRSSWAATPRPPCAWAARYDGWMCNPSHCTFDDLPGLLDSLRRQPDFAGKESTFDLGLVGSPSLWEGGSFADASAASRSAFKDRLLEWFDTLTGHGINRNGLPLPVTSSLGSTSTTCAGSTPRSGPGSVGDVRGCAGARRRDWVMVPAASVMLADFGADVVKVEHPATVTRAAGLPTGGVSPSRLGGPHGGADQPREAQGRPRFLAARGPRRAVHAGRSADVFMTSFLPSARRRYGFDVDDLRAVNPGLIYVRGSSTGPEGAEADKPGFDFTVFWARSGFQTRGHRRVGPRAPGRPPPGLRRQDVLDEHRLRGGRRPVPPGAHGRAVGDGASLLARPCGRRRATSSIRWRPRAGFRPSPSPGRRPSGPPTAPRTAAGCCSPCSSPTGCGRTCAGPSAGPTWPPTTGSGPARPAAPTPRRAQAELEAAFASRPPRASGGARWPPCAGAWEVVQTPRGVRPTPRRGQPLHRRGRPTPSGESARWSARRSSSTARPPALGWAPDIGQHTEEVLAEVGLGDRLEALRADGVIA